VNLSTDRLVAGLRKMTRQIFIAAKIPIARRLKLGRRTPASRMAELGQREHERFTVRHFTSRCCQDSQGRRSQLCDCRDEIFSMLRNFLTGT
jgi:hypothetical protein